MRVSLFTVCVICHTVAGVGESLAIDSDDGRTLGEGEALTLFESRIRPVLVEHCYECHSSAAKSPKGGLLLDTRNGARKGGDSGSAVVPGDADASLVVQAMDYRDYSLRMPPQGKLSEAIINDFRRWIVNGAPDPRGEPTAAAREPIDLDVGRRFWSFLPLHKSPVPTVADSWVRTDVDHFIFAKLAEKGLRPSPLVDRRMLIRRAYFDLLGLPPTPYQINTFVRDGDPRAYEKLIDRLLASPHYGERWGRHWLDVARYADSSGYENDNDRPHAYHYRDFVIEALNRDVPYDRFVRWQIAGDELEPDNPLAHKATGFLACGPMNGQVTEREAEKERYDVLDDWIGTTGTAFLGLTIACARCHDHKFDPFPTEDYYRLASTFTTTVRVNRNVDLDPAATRQARAAFAEQHRSLIDARDKFEQEQLPSRTTKWLNTNPSPANSPWLVLEAKKLTSGGAQTTVVTRFRRRDDGAYVVAEANGEIASHTFEAETPLTNVRALRLEILPDESLPRFGPGLGDHGDFQMRRLEVSAIPLYGDSEPLTVNLVQPFTGTSSGAPTVARADNKGAWSFAPRNRDVHWATWLFEQPLSLEGGARLRISMRFQADNPAGRKALGCFRFSVATGESLPDATTSEIPHTTFVAAREALSVAADHRTPQHKSALEQLASRYDPDWLKLDKSVRTSQLNRPWPKIDVALITTEARDLVPMRMKIQGPDFYDKTYLLQRGSLEQKVVEVESGFLGVLTRGPDETTRTMSPPAESRTTFSRAALAHWLTDIEHGAGNLLARVIVNRVWQHHLGQGLVTTPSDFGARGDRPAHPKLLDWLACKLIAGNWSLKALHKRIMTSAVYMQASSAKPEPDPRNAFAAAAQTDPRVIDPSNRLFWRRPLVRLEAEVIRDAMLAVSGRLETRQYGPGTLDVSMTRRSIYFTVKRSALIPTLVQLDWPDTLAGIGQRPTTTVAPQALFILNNPQVRTNAETFAARLMPDYAESPESTVYAAYMAAIGRAPNAREQRVSLQFLRQQAGSYSAQEGSQAAVADFCQMLFGLNEFSYIR